MSVNVFKNGKLINLSGNTDESIIAKIVDDKVSKINVPKVTNDLTNELKNNYDDAALKKHEHANLKILSKFSETTTGDLLYDGSTIGNGSSISNSVINDDIVALTKTWSSNKIRNEIANMIPEINIVPDFVSEEGFGKIRFYAGKFEYYDEKQDAWVDLVFTGDNQYIIEMMPQSMLNIIAISDSENHGIKLKWEEPPNTIINNQLACIVEGVKIIRKEGSSPVDINDGTLVMDIKARDFGKYKRTYFLDSDSSLEYGNTYYYHFYPYSDLGIYNKSTTNEVSVMFKDYFLFGFILDQNESDPEQMISYIEDNKYFKSAFMDYTKGFFDYGDWSDVWFIKDIKPCMLRYDGTVDYELNKDNYDLKEDGSPSDIENESYEGNAMIGMPKTYYKIVNHSNNTASIYVSNKKIDDNFHCWSHIDNNGNEIDYCYLPIYNGSDINNVLRSLSGKIPMHSKNVETEVNYSKANNNDENVIWYTEVLSDRMLINILLLLIGKSTDTQSVFGYGYSIGKENLNPRLETGTLNSKGLFWGNNSFNVGVKVFGMEHWWGNIWRRIAGWINDKGTQKIKLTYGESDGSTINGYNFLGDGYVVLPNSTPVGKNGGFITSMLFTEYGIFPVLSNGSATTYYTDGFWMNNDIIDYVLVGGSCGTINYDNGALYTALDTDHEFVHWTFGASISCKPIS